MGVAVTVVENELGRRARGRARRRLGERSGVALAVLGVVVCVGLSACSSGSSGKQHATQPATPSSATSGDTSGDTSPSSSTPPPPAAKAVITASLKGGSSTLNPVKPVSLGVADGKLTSVKLVNHQGKAVKGTMSTDGTSWRSGEALGYSKTYQLAATAVNADGKPTTKRMHFTTLTPNNMTLPYLNTVYGSPIENGATYGIGFIPVVNFDESIPNRAAAERSLKVTTSPTVKGSWYWLSDTQVQYRPRYFYKPGTKVTIEANVYGVDVGSGLYGQADEKVSFRIGAKHVAIANAKTHQVKLYYRDKLVRTMPTSMGQGGYVEGKYGPIGLWTMPGTYTVIGHENPATMSSDSYGLPTNSPLGYAPEKVPYSTKISTDGIYLHELDATTWAQGNSNVSHGCLNLNYDNASWYYNHSRVGDVVKVVHSGGPKVEVWQGGQWSQSWAAWKKGSALS